METKGRLREQTILLPITLPSPGVTLVAGHRRRGRDMRERGHLRNSARRAVVSAFLPESNLVRNFREGVTLRIRTSRPRILLTRQCVGEESRRNEVGLTAMVPGTVAAQGKSNSVRDIALSAVPRRVTFFRVNTSRMIAREPRPTRSAMGPETATARRRESLRYISGWNHGVDTCHLRPPLCREVK
jgi:hypothetical protein